MIVVVNGNRIEVADGSNISINNNTVMVGGRSINVTADKQITVTVSGDCGRIETGSGKVDVSGRVNGDIRTVSGSVSCGGVSGSINTVSGSVLVGGSVGGSVSSVSGSITK